MIALALLLSFGAVDAGVVGGVVASPAPKKVTSETALSALNAARSAVAQAEASAESRAEAETQLSRAEAAFEESDFPAAVQFADAAWRLVSTNAREKIRFEVNVAEDGKTEVVSKTGPPVRVEAQGETRVLYPGQKVDVAKNLPPSAVVTAPAADAGAEAPKVAVPAPKLLSPKAGQVLVLKGNPKALGPVLLKWKAVPGATRYEVTYRQGQRVFEPLLTTTTSLKLPRLPKGKYEWTVRAVAQGTSEAVAASHFELQPRDVKLEVEGAGWK